MNTDCRIIPVKPFLHGFSPFAGFTFGCSIPVTRRNRILKQLGWSYQFFLAPPDMSQSSHAHSLNPGWCPVFVDINILPQACWSVIGKGYQHDLGCSFQVKKQDFSGRHSWPDAFSTALCWHMFIVLFQAIWGQFLKCEHLFGVLWVHQLILQKPCLSKSCQVVIPGWACSGDLVSWLWTIGLSFQAEIILSDQHQPVGSWCCSHSNAQIDEARPAAPTLRDSWLLAILKT